MNKKPTRRYFHSDNKLYVKLLGGALREGTTDYYNDDNLVANKRVFQNEKRGANLYSFGTPNPKITSLDFILIFTFTAIAICVVILITILLAMSDEWTNKRNDRLNQESNKNNNQPK
jgi:hypothetical protein